MNFASSKSVKELLQKHDVRLSRGLGQNFLVDSRPISKLLGAADPQGQDTVLEIGPGIGVLTQELAKHARHVIAVEKDAKMVEILKEQLEEFYNIEIIHADALKLDTRTKIQEARYKVVANLPYYITAPTIRKFLEAEHQPASITLIIQKEVAQRICARPPHMSILAVSVQFYAQAKIIAPVKKTAFWPQPRVDSAIIHIVPKETPDIDTKKFFQIVKAGFLHPRKQLLGNLAAGLHMEKEKVAAALGKNSISPQQRAETLTIKDWENLTKEL